MSPKDSHSEPQKSTPDPVFTASQFNAAILKTVLGDYASKPAYLVWRARAGDEPGKVVKMPCNPDTGSTAAPNSARHRATLTFDEAAAAATLLREDGLPCGVGVLNSRAGFVSVDLDDTVGNSVAAWAKAIIGKNYAELSPSRKGLRCLVSEDGMDPTLLKRANGAERMKLGLYGPHTRRFTTLTGNIIEGADQTIAPLPEKQQHKIWARWAKSQAYKNTSKTHVGLYPTGKAGRTAAFLDISTGASLHLAMLWFATSNASEMTRDQCREELTDALNAYGEVVDAIVDKETRLEENARLTDRLNGLESILDWIGHEERIRAKSKGILKAKNFDGFKADISTQDRQAAKATVKQAKAGKTPKEPDNVPQTLQEWLSDEANERANYAPHENSLSAEDERELVKLKGAFLYAAKANVFNRTPYIIELEEYDLVVANGKGPLNQYSLKTIENMRVEDMLARGDDVPEYLQDSEAYLYFLDALSGMENEDTLNAIKEKIEADKGFADHDLINRMPAGTMRDIVDHAYKMMENETPEIAIMAALAGVSAVTTGYCVTSLKHKTPLTIWGQAIATSGLGKSFVEEVVQQIVDVAGVETSDMPNSKEGIHRGFLVTSAKSSAPMDASRRPSAIMLHLIDETGFWLGKLGQSDQPTTPVDAAFGFALSLYNRSIGSRSYIPESYKAAARDSRPRVNNPVLLVAGFSTSQTYMPMLNDRMLEGGWANRVLHFFTEYDAVERPFDYKRPDGLPGSLKEIIRALPAGCYNARRDADGGLDTSVMDWFYKPHDWHRATRVVQIAIDDLRVLRDRRNKLRDDLIKMEATPVLVKRFEENVFKIAGMMSVLDYAAEAVLFGEWPTGRLAVRSDHMDYAGWLVARLITTFAEKLAATAQGSIDHANAESIVKIAMKGLADPSKGKYRDPWVEALTLGFVPRGFLSKKSKLNKQPFAAALDTAIDNGDLITVPFTDPLFPEELKKKSGPAPELYKVDMPDG